MIEPWRKDLRGRRAVVVGAGLGGMVAATALALRGARVTAIEARPEPGGTLAVLDGVSIGPTSMSWPRILTSLWSHADLRFSDFVQLRAVDPPLTLAVGADRTLELWADPERFRASLAPFDELDAASVPAFAVRLAAIGRRSDRAAASPLRHLADNKWSPQFRGRQPRARSLVERSFRSPHARAILSAVLTGQGLNPLAAPLERLDLLAAWWKHGAWHPEGGWSLLLLALRRLAEFTGVRFECNCTVKHIVVRGGRTRSVLTSDGAEVPGDLIVSNADPLSTGKLLRFDDTEGPRAAPKLPGLGPSMSRFEVLVRVPRRAVALRMHTIHPSPLPPEEEWRQLAHWGVPAAQPTLEVLHESALPQEDAAPSEDAWLLFRTLAPPIGGAWRWDTDSAEGELARLLSIWRKGPLRGLLDAATDIRPAGPGRLASSYLLAAGGCYGASRPGDTLEGRFPNAWPGVVGLYLAGASCHPGPDIGQTIQSGFNAAQLAAEDFAV